MSSHPDADAEFLCNFSAWKIISLLIDLYQRENLICLLGIWIIHGGHSAPLPWPKDDPMTTKSPHADGFRRFTLTPYNPFIGAVVDGIDLGETTGEEVRADLRRALAEYGVLFFRGQTLSPERQVDVARIFGDPDKAKAYFKRHDSNRLVELIEFTPGQPGYGTDQWHADITFSANPPTGTVLHARDVPSVGGDTAWASGTYVYDRLDPALRAYLETLEAVHSIEHSGWPEWFRTQPNGEELYRQARAEHLPVVHKVVQTHPVTGRKLVYVSPNFTLRIRGLSRQQSDALLTFLFGLFEKPEAQARWRWRNGDVAIWDNRATVHYAVTDYTEYRLLHRVTFGEDTAF
ncbi:dioxygenase, TauD/TfdA family [Azospirillum argentinense]